jgi:hypothetical protein
MATEGQVQQFLLADLERRLKVVPAEVSAWKTAVGEVVAGLGIHKSQVDAVSDMMDVLAEDHAVELEKLREAQDAVEFADTCQRLLEKLGGAQDLWRIFRTILGQRQDPRLKLLADTADLIASDCHGACLRQARQWGVITEQQFREPPLTYLESSLSPSTASRGQNVQTLGFPVREYRNKMLPVPIILFPLDQAISPWMMCSIAHEVGHNVDHDLGGKPGARLSATYKKLLIGRVPNDREPQWRRWMEEVLADAIGVVLGGAGFAISMARWTISVGSATHLQVLDPSAVHPPFHLRLRLIAEMLRETQTPALVSEGDTLLQLWNGLVRPPWQAEYEYDVQTVAKLLVQEKTTQLKEHRLLDFGGDLAFAHTQCSKLAEHWGDPTRPRPHPEAPFPFRWVPSAAALASARLVQPGEAALDELQEKAVDYFAAIPRPAMLGAPGNRREFLRSLSRQLNFTSADVEEGDA